MSKFMKAWRISSAYKSGAIGKPQIYRLDKNNLSRSFYKALINYDVKSWYQLEVFKNELDFDNIEDLILERLSLQEVKSEYTTTKGIYVAVFSDDDKIFIIYNDT